MNAAFYRNTFNQDQRPTCGRLERGLRAFNRFLFCAILIGVGIIGVGLSYPVYKRHQAQTASFLQMQEELAQAEALNRKLLREERLLLNDPAYLEMIARDKLNLMKPGETILHIEKPKTDTPP